MALFSIKMRASKLSSNCEQHISGAEKIISKEKISEFATTLTNRALNHSKGEPDFINLKISKIEDEDILYLDALPVTTVEVETASEGKEEILKFLNELNIENPTKVLEFLEQSYNMRGAIILDVKNLKRLESDFSRGVRATFMDLNRDEFETLDEEKNHYLEAIVLATKVVNAPNIIGEICISDDPDYVTGYVSSKEIGYRRITKLKERGSINGGRVFLYLGDENDVQKTVDFLEKQVVIVNGVKALSKSARENWNNFFDNSLSNLKKQNLFRSTKNISSYKNATIKIGKKKLINFSSNNYLGLASNRSFQKKILRGISKYNFGSSGSPLTCGNYEITSMLESKIANFKNCEAAITFSSGYVTNVTLLSALANEEVTIFSDELNHASIIDGIKLSKAKVVIYAHNDMIDLAKKIRATKFNRAIAISDAVFSMDGDILNLIFFLNICRDNNILSIVDESHSNGVLGKKGNGIESYTKEGILTPPMKADVHRLEEEINFFKPDILMGTFSKAFGAEGGYVASSKKIVDFLRNKARGYIFSTAASPVSCFAAFYAINYIEKNSAIVTKLQNNILYFKELLRSFSINIETKSAIFPLIVGDEKKALLLAEKLYEAGIYASAIRFPTVAKNSARIRFSVTASHTKKELFYTAKTLSTLLDSLQLSKKNDDN